MSRGHQYSRGSAVQYRRAALVAWLFGEKSLPVVFLHSRPIGNALILDLGTCFGWSALAFAAHAKERGNRVISVDVVDQRWSSFSGYPIRFVRASLNDRDVQNFTRSASLILIDTAHEGFDELRFYRFLCRIGYKGLLIMDDIVGWGYENPVAMVWRFIPTRKFDLTEYFHSTGTGIVDFSGNLQIIDRDVLPVRTEPGRGNIWLQLYICHVLKPLWIHRWGQIRSCYHRSRMFARRCVNLLTGAA